jgi:S-disulfanyl-L-cysteine oxidoreductase SoxD
MRASWFVLPLLPSLVVAAGATDYGIGRPAAPGEIAAWNIDVAPDGKGLPPGHGSVTQGAEVFASKCVACHGAEGQGKPMDRLVGGQGTLSNLKPVKTVGSYWPYATTLYDFIHRAMPFNAPQTLSADETYAVTAYLLHLNEIVPEDAVLDAASLPKVVMPAHDRFTSAYEPDRATKP